MKQQMVRAGYDERIIQVLPNPAPATGEFTPPPRDGIPRMLFLSRLSIHKGLQWLIRCLPKLDRPFELDVAGDGPQRGEMEREVVRLGLQDRVIFHGWVNESRIEELVSRSRFVVFPAVWHEPAGLVTFDASSRGRAVIASRTGGIPEFAMDQRNALVVDPQDDAAMTGAMRRLIDDWDFARRLGETGHFLAQTEFALSRHILELDRVYRSLADTSSNLAETAGTVHEA